MTEWIKVTDRMPEPLQAVLVFRAKATFQDDPNEEDINEFGVAALITDCDRLIGPAFIQLNKWCEVEFDGEYEPTHWMPIPKFPCD